MRDARMVRGSHDARMTGVRIDDEVGSGCQITDRQTSILSHSRSFDLNRNNLGLSFNQIRVKVMYHARRP